MHSLPVREILSEDFPIRLYLLNQNADTGRMIRETDINRPGLALAGFFDFFASTRLQVFGQGEWAYLLSLSPADLERIMRAFFEFELVCLIFTHDHEPPALLLEIATEKRVPVLKTPASSHKFVEFFTDFLADRLAPTTTLHGVLVEVFGVGVLLQGASGVGKSETALELVERGHRLIADDAVQIKCIGEQRLYGSVSETIAHLMEIRGLGIINIKELFGAGSVRKSKRIDLVIRIEEWNEKKDYDRLGLEADTLEILGVQIDALTVPVRPGRNVPVLIETAAKNHRLKLMGSHPAREFIDKLKKLTSRTD